MWAVLVTEGRRKIKIVYDNFELAPTKVYVLCSISLSVDMSYLTTQRANLVDVSPATLSLMFFLALNL